MKPRLSTPHQTPPTTTYNDIMDTLRLLEEVPPALGPPMETTRGGEHRQSGGLSEGKLQSILSYLDQVEKAELDRSNMLAKSQSQSKGSTPSVEQSRVSSSLKDATNQKYVCVCVCMYRIAGIFRGVYISRISRKGPSLLTLKPRNLIIGSGCGQLVCCHAAGATLL